MKQSEFVMWESTEGWNLALNYAKDCYQKFMESIHQQNIKCLENCFKCLKMPFLPLYPYFKGLKAKILLLKLLKSFFAFKSLK